MANTSRICGLRPIEQPFGMIKCHYYTAATGQAYYMFQPVDLDANGRAVAATASNATLILGSIVNILDDSFGPGDKLYSGYMPANPPASYTSAGTVQLLVADDPEQLFVIEEETGGGTQLTGVDVGTAASWTYIATTGNTNSGIANACLDASTVSASDTTNTLRIIKKLDRPDNAYGAYCKWIVKIYRHRLAGQPLSAGTVV